MERVRRVRVISLGDIGSFFASPLKLQEQTSASPQA